MFFRSKNITAFLIIISLISPFCLGQAYAKELHSNIALSSQLSRSNTVYEVKEDINLNGQTIRIPNRCVLSFNGGIIRNGTLVGNNTKIKNESGRVIFTEVNLIGNWNVKVGYPEWFGAVGDGKNNDLEAVQTTINVCKEVVFKNHYLIVNAPFDYTKYNPIPEDELDYYMDLLDQKNHCSNSRLTPIIIPSNKKIIVEGTIKAYSPLGNLIEIKGDNVVITGGGTISGCGVVNSINVYSGKPDYAVTDWEAALIYIDGSNNTVENVTIKDPTKQGISIYNYLSKGNAIRNNIIGGGLRNHTESVPTCIFSRLFGIYARGSNTIVQGNTFKKLDGKNVYDALFCDYTTINVPDDDKRTEVHTTFTNNIVEDALEHAVYTYASNLIITDNTLCSDHTVLQLFHRKQNVDNNILYCNEGSIGIYVSGENQVITNNKIYNVGRYGIRCTGYYNGSCDNDYVAGNYIEKLMVPFSETQNQTSPAITFESTAFRNNKLNLTKITCENNTVICKGNSKSARTIPIVGIIAVYGDSNTTIDEIRINNNTVTNSNVGDNIGVTLMNKANRGVVIIDGNRCINDCQIISTTPGEPNLLIRGVKHAIVKNNHFEQRGETGTSFELIDVDKAVFSKNTFVANLYSKSVFYVVDQGSAITFDGSNIINGKPEEHIITVPANSVDEITVLFNLPSNRWDIDVTPINRAARKAELNNPLMIIGSDINGVKLGHETATRRNTKYKVRVIYK